MFQRTDKRPSSLSFSCGQNAGGAGAEKSLFLCCLHVFEHSFQFISLAKQIPDRIMHPFDSLVQFPVFLSQILIFGGQTGDEPSVVVRFLPFHREAGAWQRLPRPPRRQRYGLDGKYRRNRTVNCIIIDKTRSNNAGIGIFRHFPA